MRRLLAIVLSAVFPLHVFPQRGEPLAERIEVQIINVDVTITGPDGLPAGGLTASDFEILEDGRPQRINGFHAIENSAVRSIDEAAAPARSEQFRRKVVVMIDNTSMNKIERDRAIDELLAFIRNDFREDHEWSISLIGADVRILQGFTNDKNSIESSLIAAKETPTLELQREADRRLLSDPIRARLRDAEFATGYDFGETARFQSRENTLRALKSTGNFASAVIQTTRAYSAAEGKKLLVLLTGGMDLNTTLGAYESKRDRSMMEMRRDLERIFDTVVREVNAANFTMYVLNARGRQQVAPQYDVVNRSLGTGGTARSSAKSEGFAKGSDITNVDGPALSMALGTGGSYFAGNDIGKSLERVDVAASNFYSLAYSPQHAEDNRYHRIEVRVRKPGHRISHRSGYMHLTPEQRFEQELRAPLMFPKQKGSLPVRLELGVPRDVKARPVEIPLRAVTAMKTLTVLPREGRYVGRVHVYTTIFDEEGRNIGFDHHVQNFQFPAADAKRALEGAFRYSTKVNLASGSYTVIVTLRDELTNEIGSAIQNVKI